MFGYNNFPHGNCCNRPEDKPENKPNGCCEEMPYVNNFNCCPRPKCCPTVTVCKPIMTCSKQVVNQYHIVRQPHVHNFHTEIVHHHITENEFIPTYSCSEVHLNDNCGMRPRF